MEENIQFLIRNNPTEAINLLYDRYSHALFGIILRIVQSRELAQQVLQDTFVKAWKHGPQYDSGKGRIFTWLLNIARNTAIDATRTAYFKHYRQTDDAEQLHQQESSQSINPDHIGLRTVVDELDEKYRVLIDLIYFKGYTQQEVEQELGIPAGTIKTRLRYAVSELRKAFEVNRSGETAMLIFFLDHFIATLKPVI